MREQLKEWKLKSFEKYNFQCILSNGNNKLNIHHLNKNFSEIVYEVLKTLNLKLYNSIGDYSFKALDSIVNLCLELHDKYGLGVPIESDLHIIFHKLYGKENNTSEQFEEFTKRYYAGEFN